MRAFRWRRRRGGWFVDTVDDARPVVMPATPFDGWNLAGFTSSASIREVDR